MSHIFISYRRTDTQDVVGRIYDRLSDHFSRANVFKDVDSIPLAVPFLLYLKYVLSNAKLVLVIIGPNWLAIDKSTGRRRLDDTSDYVRLEVETALTLDVPLIPLTVSHAPMPVAHDLPESMQELACRQGQPVRPDPDFHRDMERLISQIESLLGGVPEVATATSRRLSLTESTAARLGETSFYHWFHVQFKADTKLPDAMANRVNELIGTLQRQLDTDARHLSLLSSITDRLNSGLYNRTFIDEVALALERQYDTRVAGAFLLGYCTGVAVGHAQTPQVKSRDETQGKLSKEIAQAAELAEIPHQNVTFLIDGLAAATASGIDAVAIAEQFWSALGRPR